MTRAQLKDELIAMVERHGFDRVERQLNELAITERTNSAETLPSVTAVPRHSRSKRKPTASEYVSKLGVPLEKERPVSELAARFENKTFLPSFGDVVNFCHSYRIDVPASRSRANAMPRVFKLLVSLERDEIRRIVDERHFSGPSRLRPISDAIRRSSRAAVTVPAKRR